MTKPATYVLDRSFAAPPELVWKAWTDKKLLSRWYGPNVETIIHKLDVRPGGEWLLEMKWGGKSNFQRGDYKEVVVNSRLVWLHSSTDERWNIVPSPMMPDWPKTLLTTVTFEKSGNETAIRLVWEPHNASDAEVACFAGAISRMGMGWESGMKILADILAELQT